MDLKIHTLIESRVYIMYVFPPPGGGEEIRIFENPGRNKDFFHKKNIKKLRKNILNLENTL